MFVAFSRLAYEGTASVRYFADKRGNKMTATTAIVPVFTHFIPIMFLVFMMTDIFWRNPRRTEHRLACGIILSCLSMFMEEFVRHYLPVEYSPIMTAAWFSTSGIMITGLGLHLFVKLARVEHKFPKFVYPYLFYLPVVLVFINLLFNDQMISGSGFREAGIWKLPEFNTAYYVAMLGSNVYNVFYVIILSMGKKQAHTREQKEIYNQLIAGVIVTAVFNLGPGMIDFNGLLPPYPYIYGTVAWCILLRHTMLKYDFLNYVDKRYERLFNLSPAAIMLVDMRGRIKEANPGARRMFDELGIKPESSNFFSVLDEEIKKRIAAHEEIRNFETVIRNGGKRMDALIDGDYVMVEYEPYLIFIVRDITLQKEDQRKIAFLAYHDTLTRLPNRTYFFEKFDEALNEAKLNEKNWESPSSISTISRRSTTITAISSATRPLCTLPTISAACSPRRKWPSGLAGTNLRYCSPALILPSRLSKSSTNSAACLRKTGSRPATNPLRSASVWASASSPTTAKTGWR